MSIPGYDTIEDFKSDVRELTNDQVERLQDIVRLAQRVGEWVDLKTIIATIRNSKTIPARRSSLHGDAFLKGNARIYELTLTGMSTEEATQQAAAERAIANADEILKPKPTTKVPRLRLNS